MAGTLTIRKQAFLEALLSPRNRTIAAACEAAGISTTTGTKWRRDPDFAAALDNAQSELLREVGARMIGTLPQVETTFVRIMLDDQNSAGVRLRAAAELRDTALRIWEILSFEARLAALEEGLHEAGNR